MPKASRVPMGVYTMAFIMAIKRLGNITHHLQRARRWAEQDTIKGVLSVLSSSENIGKFWHAQHHICSMYYIALFNKKSIITAKHILLIGKVIVTGNFAKSLAQEAC